MTLSTPGERVGLSYSSEFPRTRPVLRGAGVQRDDPARAAKRDTSLWQPGKTGTYFPVPVLAEELAAFDSRKGLALQTPSATEHARPCRTVAAGTTFGPPGSADADLARCQAAHHSTPAPGRTLNHTNQNL